MHVGSHCHALVRRTSMRPAAMAAARKWRAPVIVAVRGNSFIKQVMEQVKRDMEQDERMKKDWEKVQKSSEGIRERSVRHQEKFQDFSETAKGAFTKAGDALGNFRERASGSYAGASERLRKVTDEHETLKRTQEAFSAGAEVTKEKSSAVFSWTKEKFSGVMDTSSKLVNRFNGEDAKGENIRQWKAMRDVAKAQQEAREAAEAAAKEATVDSATDSDKAKAESAPQESGDALVVSKVGSSSWDRFGSRLRDMPFLSSAFDNPLFDRIFGESEIAASIREMKDLDYSFCLEDFAEDIEYVVAPHVIQSFLDGNSEALEKHCGEAAFAAVNASIKARKSQKLTLDPAILAGPSEVELKGAKLMDKGSPYFIWTFNTQQVNCLRDRDGNVIEGAVDDIRTVIYAMAVTKHPELDNLDLDYPWQISELAILGNQPCW